MRTLQHEPAPPTGRPTNHRRRRAHRRNRQSTHHRKTTGCFVCRVRRKGCDEAKPACTACDKFALPCTYQSPQWWYSKESQQEHLEKYKRLIEARGAFTKLSQHVGELARAGLPCGVLEGLYRGGGCSRESEQFLSKTTSSRSSTGISHCASSKSGPIQVGVGQKDWCLLSHFVVSILPAIFPIFESSQHRWAGRSPVVSGLQSNTAYLHYCLSVAAQHLKPHADTSGVYVDDDVMDDDVVRHRCAAIRALCEALGDQKNPGEILEVILGLIVYNCFAFHTNDGLPDMPWHWHFDAAVALVRDHNLLGTSASSRRPCRRALFNRALFSWIDIIGATMKGRPPAFADVYREKNESQTDSSLGLRELMGCDDQVMYLISEIACLEFLKKERRYDINVCEMIESLSEYLTWTQTRAEQLETPVDADGSLSFERLSKNITLAFCISARIYLCSLTPGFNYEQPIVVALVEALTVVLRSIPSGPEGFDRSLVWAYLIGGAFSLPNSTLRTHFKNRLILTCQTASFGTLACVATLLDQVWRQNDYQWSHIHWRDVMESQKWDLLLI